MSTRSADSAADAYTWRRLLHIIAGYHRPLLAANRLGIVAVVVTVPLLLPLLAQSLLRPAHRCDSSPLALRERDGVRTF